MPSLTFTADSGTDLLTSVGHGLLTGDGPLALHSCGGLLAAPLLSTVEYFAIKIDNDNIKVALSSTDAVAGTAVGINDNGTGTQLIEVGLPYRRPRTYAAGVQIKSADLNAGFDTATGRRHPTVRRNVPLVLQWIDSTNTWEQYQAAGTNKNGLRSTSITGVTVSASSVDVPYEVGDRIEGVEVHALSDGTASSKAALLFLVVDASTIVVSGTDTIATGATKTLFQVPASSGINHVMAPGERLRFAFVASGSTGYVINCVNLVVSRPS